MDNRNTKTSSQNAKTTNTAKNSSKNCMGGKGTK